MNSFDVRMQPLVFPFVIGMYLILKIMNKTLSKLLQLLIIPLVIFSCEKVDEKIHPKEKLASGTSFNAKYIVPLTTGRDNGETEIVDAANAAAKNVAELKPVFTEMVKLALNGDIPSYPDDWEDPEKDPKTFLKRRFDKVASSIETANIEDLNLSFEMSFEGEAFDGYSKMTPEYIDITYVDHANEHPDQILGRVYMKDLNNIYVSKGESKLPLPNYLETRDFEHYVIRVYTPQDSFGIRTHADARTVQQKLEQGMLENLNPNIIP